MRKLSANIFGPFIILAIILLKISTAFSQDKFKVRAIQFFDNKAYAARLLKNIMLTKKSTWVAKNYFQKNLFEDDLKIISNFYMNEGFLEVRIENYHLEFDSLQQQVSIQIRIHEGERTTIEGVSFFGNAIISDSILFKRIKSSIHQPFRKSVLENDTYSLLAYYADHGYIEARVTPTLKLNQEQHTILIDYNIEEGALVRIGKFQISGTQKTKPSVLLRELNFRTGDVYSYARILKSQRNLYLTGLFTSVFIRPEENSAEIPSVRDIRIAVEEKKNGELNFGFGYGTLDHVRGSIELLQHNLWGTARQVGLSTFMSAITRRVELSFSDPWLFSTKTKTDANAFIEKREEPGYDLSHYGSKFTLGRRFGDFSNLNLAYRYEIVRLSAQVSPDLLKLNEKGNTRSLTLTIIRDARNDLINTTQGAYSSLDVESAGAFLKGTSTFIKLSVKHNYYYPIAPRLILASALSAGWMNKFGVSKDIPIQERFFTGGASSVRGFKEKYVGPRNELNNPIGGNILLTLNLLELRYMFYKKLSAIWFVDVGNVWANGASFQKFGLRKGLGFGLRYNSPLGILRFDYGLKLDRQKGEAPGEFYFSVGQAF